jgi:NACalpha-BTF3-like transcription factor
MEPTRENIARLGSVDVARKVAVHVKFFRVDPETQERLEEIEVQEVATKVAQWISDQMGEEKMKAENNNIRRKIIPLMGHVMANASIELVGPQMAYFLLHQQMLRTHCVFMMSTGYTLNQFMRRHNLAIEVTEVPLTDTEIEIAVRQSKENDVKAISQLTGIPEDALRKAWDEHGDDSEGSPDGSPSKELH